MAVVWASSLCVCDLSSVQYLIDIMMKPFLWLCEFDAMFVSVLGRNFLPFQTIWGQPIT